MAGEQAQIDDRNAAFWDELCGSALARQIGVTGHDAESLKRFDEAYFGLYPYLDRYLPGPARGAQRLLEVGLGYGTVGQVMAERGYEYFGLDIAPGPVEMMRSRLTRLGASDVESKVVCGSALEMPFGNASFDRVVTIGCLHHTGDVPTALSEVHRVLRPSGVAVIMLYNRRSIRQLDLHTRGRLRQLVGGGSQTFDERVRAAYDANAADDAAPATEFFSVGDVRRICSKFASVDVTRENFDPLRIWRFAIPRERLLSTLGRLAGLDLYITATK